MLLQNMLGKRLTADRFLAHTSCRGLKSKVIEQTKQ